MRWHQIIYLCAMSIIVIAVTFSMGSIVTKTVGSRICLSMFSVILINDIVRGIDEGTFYYFGVTIRRSTNEFTYCMTLWTTIILAIVSIVGIFFVDL